MSFGRMTLFSTCVVIAALTFGAIAKPPQKIVNGKRANLTEFPFMVSLRYLNNLHFCGGSIISRSHVLTAAHCVKGEKVDEIVAVTGTNKLGSEGVLHYISKITSHPNYSEDDASMHGYVHNDIAVLTLTESLSGDDQSWKIINLASKDYGPGLPATNIGFGQTAFGDDQPNSEYLLKMDTKLVDINKCKVFPHNPNGNDQLCTPVENGQSFCDGDSGGPLIVKGEVVGIVSYTIKCGVRPSIYTKVFRYLDFIKKATRTGTFRKH